MKKLLSKSPRMPNVRLKNGKLILMHKTSRQLLGIIALSILSIAPGLVRAADGPYHPLKEIPIGGASSWDYSSVDETGRRLYMSHGSEVVVIDVDKDAVVGVI